MSPELIFSRLTHHPQEPQILTSQPVLSAQIEASSKQARATSSFVLSNRKSPVQIIFINQADQLKAIMSGTNNGGGIGGGSSSHHHARKRSRTNSNLSVSTNTPPPFRQSFGGTASGSASGGSSHHHHHQGSSNKFILDKNERLLRLNVGGYPYDVVRTSLPLLETMMTDRWLASCLVDSDGRIFIDRDGDAFGDILRYLRGGADFLLELVHSSAGASTCASHQMSSHQATLSAAASSSNISKNNMDRLRRLRTEADYYGLHQLVHDIDVVTVGQRVVFETSGWARVAGGCIPRNQRLSQQQQQANNQNDNDQANNDANNNDVEIQNEMDPNNEQEEQEADNPNEDQAMEDHENEEEEEAAEEADDVEEEDHFALDEEEEVEDPTQPPPYKHWSWCKQYGNPDILKPHPTHSSSMVVGQDGSYLLLLRLAAALPSPLARIRWDTEQEEDRRVTRGALRSRSSRHRRPSDDGSDEEDVDDSNSPGRSKELEEDYFVTVNIEAPLQTVMDSVDESQTHFPLLRAGLWDYRTEDEVLNEDPVFATFCGVDVVSLRSGDILSVSFMNDEVSRERISLPDNAPPELVNSLTLVRVYGTTLARYERLKYTPSPMQNGGGNMGRHPRRGSEKGGGGNMATSPRRKTPSSRRLYSDGNTHRDNMDEDSPDDEFDCEAEEFDRGLTRSAHWIKPRSDFLPTPFNLSLRPGGELEFPQPGHYLLLGRVALGCRRDATFHSVLSGGPIEGHRAQLSVRSVGGRLLHAVGFAFEEKPRLEWADLSILSENAMFNDVIHVPQAGTEMSITTTGDCRLHPEGTEVGPFCSAVSQSLSCLLLDDDIMEGMVHLNSMNVIYRLVSYL